MTTIQRTDMETLWPRILGVESLSAVQMALTAVSRIANLRSDIRVIMSHRLPTMSGRFLHR
jgi:hypothetical protein